MPELETPGNTSRRIAAHTCTKCEQEPLASVVQVCEADSAASNRWPIGVGEGGRTAARRTAGFVRHEQALALCTCVATPPGRSGRSELLSPEQVARICGLSRRAVYRAIARGDLAAARLCNRLRVRPEDLDRWISQSVERPAVPRPSVVAPEVPPARGSLRHMLDDMSANGDSGR